MVLGWPGPAVGSVARGSYLKRGLRSIVESADLRRRPIWVCFFRGPIYRISCGHNAVVLAFRLCFFAEKHQHFVLCFRGLSAFLAGFRSLFLGVFWKLFLGLLKK